jgi:uncharacterized membrane protein
VLLHISNAPFVAYALVAFVRVFLLIAIGSQCLQAATWQIIFYPKYGVLTHQLRLCSEVYVSTGVPLPLRDVQSAF